MESTLPRIIRVTVTDAKNASENSGALAIGAVRASERYGLVVSGQGDSRLPLDEKYLSNCC